MPPRASGSNARAQPEEDDFIVPDADDDSGDDFMDQDDDDDIVIGGRQSSRLRSRSAIGSSTVAKNGSHAAISKKAKAKAKDAGGSYAWESAFARPWENVNEDESGSLEASVKHLMAAGKRKRAAREEKRVRRGIIRHLVLIIDASENMSEKDGGRGRRIDVLLPIARRFVSEYFEQNPIGQLAILAMRDGVADRLVSMGGNTSDHLAALGSRWRLEPRGDPSLQNALEMAKSTLAHLPSTSSREILLLSGSLTSCDPGNIHQTLKSLKQANIRVDLIHLTAEMKIMRDIAQETGGTFGVALDDGHLEELVREGVRPREVIKKESKGTLKPKTMNGSGNGSSEEDSEEEEEGAELMQMGFPLRLPTHAPPTLCACHSRLFPPSTSSSSLTSSKGGPTPSHGTGTAAGAGFLCPRCNVKICDVPTDCPVCGLTVVMSTHLARSYRHLFPVKTFRAVSWRDLKAISKSRRGRELQQCRGCSEDFAPIPHNYEDYPEHTSTSVSTNGFANGNINTGAGVGAGAGGDGGATGNTTATLAQSGRYECPKCTSHFCLECDSYVHEDLFVCPGCG